MTDSRQTATTGTWWVTAECPRCGQSEVLPLVVGVVLTVPDDDAATIRLRAKSGKQAHLCGQTTIRVDRDSGEVLPLRPE